MLKGRLSKTSGWQFHKWLFGPEKFSGLSRNVPLGPVARSLVIANRWLEGIKTYRFAWYLTLVSTNHASSKRCQNAIL